MLTIQTPDLRKKTPFVALALLACLMLADLQRSPQTQSMAGVYLWAVRQYQHSGRPMGQKFIRCRFTPTCSVYSIQAVQKYGLAKGLLLTAHRLYSCQRDVPFGTVDPIP